MGVVRRAPRIAAAILLLVLTAPVVLAADDGERIRALERRLETSMRLIEQLSARIAELERAAKAPATAAAAASAVPPTATAAASAASAATEKSIAALQEEVNQLAEGLARRADTGLPLHGFADVDAGYASSGDPLKLRGFYAGTLDLYLTPQFGDRVRALAEIAIEYDPDGTGTIDMERLQLGYTVSDSLTLWMGRFHTPFGVWNTAFHHGANLQTSIYRPQFVEFEDRGGLIPAHSVGVWASGKHELGSGKATYDLYVANGPTIRHRRLDFNPFTDDTRAKMVGVNVGYQPGGALRGLWVGSHAFTSRVDARADDGSLIAQNRLRVGGAYASYEAHDWEVYSEYYRFWNGGAGGGKTRISNAGYLHVGRTFGTLTPYVRWERTSLDPGDPYFLAQRTGRSFTRSVAGARYAIDARSSFKVELSRTEEGSAGLIDGMGIVVPTPATRYDRAAFQYSIAF